MRLFKGRQKYLKHSVYLPYLGELDSYGLISFTRVLKAVV